jgi:hypothetical protein
VWCKLGIHLLRGIAANVLEQDEAGAVLHPKLARS